MTHEEAIAAYNDGTLTPPMTPIFSNVLILPDPVVTEKNGIRLSGSQQEKPLSGTIVKVGPGSPGRPMTLKAGMRVLYSQWVGTKVDYVSGVPYLMTRDQDLLAILED